MDSSGRIGGRGTLSEGRYRRRWRNVIGGTLSEEVEERYRRDAIGGGGGTLSGERYRRRWRDAIRRTLSEEVEGRYQENAIGGGGGTLSGERYRRRWRDAIRRTLSEYQLSSYQSAFILPNTKKEKTQVDGGINALSLLIKTQTSIII